MRRFTTAEGKALDTWTYGSVSGISCMFDCTLEIADWTVLPHTGTGKRVWQISESMLQAWSCELTVRYWEN